MRMRFLNAKTQVVRAAIYGLVAATIVGCGAPVALLANPDKDIVLKYIRPAGFKLDSTTVAWIDNPSVYINYQYKVHKALKDVPPSPEFVKKVEDEVKHLLTMLRKELPANLQTSMEKVGVERGDNYRIEIKPTVVDRLDEFIGMQVRLDVQVLNREGKKVWATGVSAKRGYNMVGIDFTNQDKAYIEKTLEVLLTRMRKAELLSDPVDM